MKLTYACCVLTATLLPLSTLWLRAVDPASSTNQPTTALGAAQDEAVKRQQLIMSANQAVADGQRLLGDGKYDDAAGRFQYAVDAVTPGGSSAGVYQRACKGLAAAKAGQAQDLAKQAKFAMAAQKLQEAINFDPENPAYPKDLEDLKAEQIAYQKQVDDPEGTINNPAVTDEFKDRVATVQKLLFQGDAYFKTGQFDKAEETYSKILLLDPYNKAARDKMAHVEKYKIRADSFRTEEYTGERMEKVDHDWSQSISPDLVIPDKPQGPIVDATTRVAITRKLQSIIIDKVNFDKLDIATVIQFLTAKSKELDPDHKGINFVLRLSSNTPVEGAPTGPTAAPGSPVAPGATTTPPPPIHREVSITLDNVPLIELLNYITEQTNLQFSVEDYAVYLRPSIDEGETLSVRTYLVPPNFFTGTSLRVSAPTGGDTSATTVTTVSVKVTDELASRGIRFPNGATATFLPGSSKLVVRNTPEQLDLIYNLIQNLSKETPQVQIEAKIAEFSEDALKSLSFNYTLGTLSLGVLGSGSSTTQAFGAGGAQTGLRTAQFTSSAGTGGLTPNSISTLIEQNPGSGIQPAYPNTGAAVAPNAANFLEVGAILDGSGLEMVVNAINNTVGASLLAAPSVTTQNGQKASIDLVREFIYPNSFEKPKLSSTQVAYTDRPNEQLQLAIPPTPRDFVEQDIGVNLEVKPTTYPDQRIDLDITKADVIDFDGFINYGVPITALLTQPPPNNTTETVLTPGIINMPVFNLRSVVTNLQVLDGQTAVLGGLIREDTQEINDKVPGLGDLPLVGRLFQSKVSERLKYNLLFFITARLIRSNGKPQYTKTLDAEPQEEKLDAPEQSLGPGVTLPPLPEGTPNS
jgi:general secretion pathway protein D